MSDEIIIRKEAKEFYNHSIHSSTRNNPIDIFHELKNRLYDFYSYESKAIFLDEIESNLTNYLKEHRKKAHGGQAKPDCPVEVKTEKLIFYIKQEIGTLPTIAHQRYQTSDIKLRNKVFISYSHLDNDILIDIRRHFKPFLGKIDYWDDSKIQPGQKWKEEIKNAILETKVAIFIVSTDFLGSEFIASDEIPPLLDAAEKEGATILTLIARPCFFEEFDHLNQYQAMNPPSRPYSKMDANEREELLVNLVRQTKKLLENQG